MRKIGSLIVVLVVGLAAVVQDLDEIKLPCEESVELKLTVEGKQVNLLLCDKTFAAKSKKSQLMTAQKNVS